ncbi:UDP-galactopyranose mutase [Spinactinospora alkalitolerans]|uniref:UDP-galactopyranose mutase n=1 Tax=Spinactinospora alkalitolerans TaxID=687207 RepID=A0A852TSY2_9ACTN|nr:FAD-dependent oxidoreductase [Spinactinospora alkalitolerans]NYE47038.1 UDP-galactopyranose mutase [Spinactinospora alkalitolerans]
MTGDRLVIIGAGPTGLGAAHRLRELGCDAWVLLEASDGVGGLARSYLDEAGFTYDIGGHVIFSHYPYVDRLLDGLLGDDHTTIRRSAWIRMRQRHIPYPFQNHFGGLDAPTVYECLRGLVGAHVNAAGSPPRPRHFADWIDATFGDGIARHFMRPYNAKVWATPLHEMAYQWIGERVSVVDVDAALRHVVLGDGDLDWGPNSTFRYPAREGTGYLYTRLARPLTAQIRLHSPVVRVEPERRVVHTADGAARRYGLLLSTMPMDDLVRCCDGAPPHVRAAARRLAATGTHVVGVGLDRPVPSERTWVYYPEPDVPFHRVTLLSNYSPRMTARPDQSLLLAELSVSRHRPVDAGAVVASVLRGMERVGLLRAGERPATTWHCLREKSHPVPTLDRDAALAAIEPWLAGHGISSRGRMGAWRYEIGNMDHALMQGAQWAERALTGGREDVWERN